AQTVASYGRRALCQCCRITRLCTESDNVESRCRRAQLWRDEKWPRGGRARHFFRQGSFARFSISGETKWAPRLKNALSRCAVAGTVKRRCWFTKRAARE